MSSERFLRDPNALVSNRSWEVFQSGAFISLFTSPDELNMQFCFTEVTLNVFEEMQY